MTPTRVPVLQAENQALKRKLAEVTAERNTAVLAANVRLGALQMLLSGASVDPEMMTAIIEYVARDGSRPSDDKGGYQLVIGENGSLFFEKWVPMQTQP